MMACCSRCYGKYLNTDGTVNVEAYEQSRQQYAGIAKKRRDRRPQAEQQRLDQIWPPYSPGLVLCDCPCHVIGTNILH